MKQEKEARLSYWAHHLTTVVSVTLVLLLIGIIAVIWIGADAETRRLKERIELSVIMSDTVPPAVAARIADELRNQPYAQNIKVISKEEALEAWKKDTGEDLMELFGVNPLSEEVTFGVKAEYASVSRIKEIEKKLSVLPGVEAVSSPEGTMIDAMNENIEQITVILGIVAIVMLVISFVLINNTVHLTIYSRRFSIHTMKLVGATHGFIRRPIILNNMLAGLIAGVAAAGILAIVMAASRQSGLPDIADFVGWGTYGFVAGAIVAAGMLLCAFASWIAAGRYLRSDYNDLFK